MCGRRLRPTASEVFVTTSSVISGSARTASAPSSRRWRPSPRPPTGPASRCGATRSGRRSELRTGTQPRDADAFVAFDRRIRSLGAFLARVQATEPPDLASPSLADATGGLTLLNGLRHLGKEQLREALRVLPMSVADLVGEAVEDEALRGVLGARGIRYAAMGPRSAGTALNFLWDSASGGGAAGRTVFARGGPDSLVEALVASARSNGATIRCDADVAAIRTGRGSVEGVALGERRGDRRADRRIERRPQADPSAPRRPGRGRPDSGLAGRAHPHARRGGEGDPRPGGLAGDRRR